MELSEAKEFWKNRAECFRIEIKNNKGKTPKDMLEKEKLEHAAQSIDTVLKALDSKDRMIKLLIADLQSEGYLNMSLEEIMRYYQNRKDEV